MPRLPLLLLLIGPAAACAQSLVPGIDIAAPPPRPAPPPARADFDRAASIPPHRPNPPGYRDARPNLDPFLPHRSGIERPITTPSFNGG